MNEQLSHVIAKIHSIPDRPHSTSPEFIHWFADQVWGATVLHCASLAGPQCASDILAGIDPMEDQKQSKLQLKRIASQNGGPGWVGVL